MSPEYKGPKSEHKPSTASQIMAKLIKESQKRQRGSITIQRVGIQPIKEVGPATKEEGDLVTRAWRGAGKDPGDRYLQIRK